MIANSYETWKKHIPQLYDFVFIYELESPSLTVEWSQHVDKNLLGTQSQKILLGTDFSTPKQSKDKDKQNVDDDRNYLEVLQVHFCVSCSLLSLSHFCGKLFTLFLCLSYFSNFLLAEYKSHFESRQSSRNYSGERE